MGFASSRADCAIDRCLAGDVDSLAALTLGLVCGTEGLQFAEQKVAQRSDALAFSLIEELEGVEYLASVATRFEEWAKRTQQYRPRPPRKRRDVSVLPLLAFNALAAAAAVAVASLIYGQHAVPAPPPPACHWAGIMRGCAPSNDATASCRMQLLAAETCVAVGLSE